MTTITHPYFGSLSPDSPNVIWERELPFGDGTVETTLWLDGEEFLNPAVLDDFAALLGRLPEIDAQARTALAAYLTADDSYITLHVQEMDGGDQLPTNPAAFAAAMTLQHIGLWLSDPTEDESEVVLDYIIDPENTNYLLAVRLSTTGTLQSIDWES